MPPAYKPRFQDDSERTIVVGRTGSGKTVMAMYILSRMNFDEIPWVIVDYKGDEHINSIPFRKYITYTDPLPTKPGIYILRMLPGEDEQITAWLWRVWNREDMGLVFDEGTLMGHYNNAFNACLTQGRSKHIPMIILTQRPVDLSKWAFSEASFWVVFDLTDDEDRLKISRKTRVPKNYELPDYHSYYFDVGKKQLVTAAPAPRMNKIMQEFSARIPIERPTL